jgi:hypothetical protein
MDSAVPSTTALRMRAYRARKRRGFRCFQIKMNEDEVNGLVAKRYLEDHDRADQSAVETALEALVSDVLGAHPLPVTSTR